LSQLQVWPRRQKVQQQILARSTPMEEVERIDVVVINLNQ